MTSKSEPRLNSRRSQARRASKFELSFVRHLQRQLEERPPATKGKRTRERIKIAAATVMSEHGYHAMRLSDVTDAAGVAEGSFYVYFRDKRQVARVVLTQFLTGFFPREVQLSRTPFASIRSWNRRWLSVCRANVGLMRCMLQLSDERPEFARLLHWTNGRWCRRIAASVVRRHRPASVRGDAALLAAYLLTGMMDDLVRRLVVYPDRGFARAARSLAADDAEIADAATIIWMRALYPRSALREPLRGAAAALRALGSGRSSRSAKV